MENEVIANEEIVNTEEEVLDDSIGSNEEDEEELSIEELKAKYEELKKKNESAEEIAKRLKDEKSAIKRQESELTKKQQTELDRSNFLANTLNEVIESEEGLTEDHFKLAKEKGVSPEVLELSLYKFKETVNTVYEKAGGKDKYFEMVNTVKESVDEETGKAYKQLLMNPKTMDIALEALENKYNKLSGNTQEVDNDNRIVANSAIENNTSVYKSIEEYYSDMRKLRKLPSGKQSDFRKGMESKLNRSKII